MLGKPPNFNPRGPCGPRLVVPLDDSTVTGVFQSSRSLRTATCLAHHLMHKNTISILAVLADRDLNELLAACGRRKYFNPRGPCGPRHGTGFETGRYLGISILAVLADRDLPWISVISSSSYFNPRGPCGPRQQRRTKDLPHLCTKRRIFSPHQKVFCGKDGKTNVFPPLPRAFSGANLPGSVRALGPRTRSSGSLPAGRSACSQSARSCSRISFPGSKNADYPAPDP